MRIYKNDIIKASAISTGADRGVLLPMILAAMCGDDAFVLNTKRGKGMQSTYRREKIVRTEKEFDINGTKVMAYSRKERRPVKVCALCICIMNRTIII